MQWPRMETIARQNSSEVFTKNGKVLKNNGFWMNTEQEVFSQEAVELYNKLVAIGACNHKPTSKIYAKTLFLLKGILKDSGILTPYHNIHFPIKRMRELASRQYTQEEVVRFFTMYLDAQRRKGNNKSLPIASFIVSGTNKPFSWLLHFAIEYEKYPYECTEAEASAFTKTFIAVVGLNPPENSVQKVCSMLRKIEQEYPLNPAFNHIHHNDIYYMFCLFVRTETNKLTFDLRFISSEFFLQKFMHFFQSNNLSAPRCGGSNRQVQYF